MRCRFQPATLLKVTTFDGCFSRFLNSTNGPKSSKNKYFTLMKCLHYLIYEIMKIMLSNKKLYLCLKFAVLEKSLSNSPKILGQI